MQGLFVLVVALLVSAATPAAAQQGAGGAIRRSGFQCPGCDSAQVAAARQRWVDAEISALTLELARSQMLYKNLESRLAPDSKEPPRTAQERAELRARLAAETSQMYRLMSELSARCGEQEPLRGYLGVSTYQPMTEETSGGRTTTRLSYHIVETVSEGSPAERAGIQEGDTLIAINRADARVRSLEPYVREPGAKLNLTISRDGVRRDIAVTVGKRPPTFDGACMQYRDYRFVDAAGQSVVMYRGRGATGAGGTGAASGSGGGIGQGGTGVRGRVNVGGQGPVRVVLPPDSTAAQSAFIMITPDGAGGALFLPRGASSAWIAGAEVSLVNGELKTIFAVEHGALVTNVAPRTPAEQAGIISGDVIVKANGENVTTISLLQRVIMTAQNKGSVTLDVIRAKQARRIILRW
jgi:serine protease Do